MCVFFFGSQCDTNNQVSQHLLHYDFEIKSHHRSQSHRFVQIFTKDDTFFRSKVIGFGGLIQSLASLKCSVSQVVSKYRNISTSKNAKID